jgi:hypothetical protein
VWAILLKHETRKRRKEREEGRKGMCYWRALRENKGTAHLILGLE